MDPRAVERVVVVGAGTMGNGIARVFSRAGIEVGLVDVDRVHDILKECGHAASPDR